MIRVMLSELGMETVGESSSLLAQAGRISDRARAMERDGFFHGVHRTLAVARAHYSTFDLEAVSGGYPLGYTEELLEGFDAMAANYAGILAANLEDEEEEPTPNPSPAKD